MVWDVVKKVGGAVVGGAAGIALGGPAGIPGAIAGAAGAFAGQSDPAQKAMEKALNTAADVGKKIAVGVGEVIIKIGETAIDVFNSLIPGTIGIRPMRQSEIDIADKVFNKNLRTLQTQRIRIISIAGMSGRPFCIPGSMITTLGGFIPLIGPLLMWTSIVTGLVNEYVIFFGEEGFRDSINYKLGPKTDGTTTIRGQKLVHELVHVWQGHRHLFAPTYVGNSLWNQCSCAITGDDSYDYKQTGKQWNQYTAEEQGRLVEDWWRVTNGEDPKSPDPARQPYIDTNIRAGSLDAKISSFSTIATSLKLGGLNMTQLLDALDVLRARRNAYATMGYNPVILAELSRVNAEIAALEAMVRNLVSKGFLIEDRAMFAVNTGSQPRVSSTGPARPSPILRR